MVDNEGDTLTRVVVCTPREQYFLVADCATHNIHQWADPAKTEGQHHALKTVLVQSGCEVIDLPELPQHPNSVFTRDTALCTPKGFIHLRMGFPSRRGEDEWMAKALMSLHEPWAGKIDEPGTVEGGDVILAGTVAFVGISSRTNPEGARQISLLLRDMGFEVRTATVHPSHLHLGGGMSVIGPKRVLCCRGEFPGDFFRGFDIIEVTHRQFAAGNVICLAENEVIADSSGEGETVLELEKAGVKVHSLDLSEFRKGTGGPSCLILPLERRGLASVGGRQSPSWPATSHPDQ
jgi:dimethylargininase